MGHTPSHADQRFLIMVRPNLLLCFDAFGTLFRPKRNVALQYAEVARQCGLTNFSDDDLRASFAAAFKREAKANPNYGRATGLGATQWWTNVSRGNQRCLRNRGHASVVSSLTLLCNFRSSTGLSILTFTVIRPCHRILRPDCYIASPQRRAMS